MVGAFDAFCVRATQALGQAPNPGRGQPLLARGANSPRDIFGHKEKREGERALQVGANAVCGDLGPVGIDGGAGVEAVGSHALGFEGDVDGQVMAGLLGGDLLQGAVKAGGAQGKHAFERMG